MSRGRILATPRPKTWCGQYPLMFLIFCRLIFHFWLQPHTTLLVAATHNTYGCSYTQHLWLQLHNTGLNAGEAEKALRQELQALKVTVMVLAVVTVAHQFWCFSFAVENPHQPCSPFPLSQDNLHPRFVVRCLSLRNAWEICIHRACPDCIHWNHVRDVG